MLSELITATLERHGTLSGEQIADSIRKRAGCRFLASADVMEEIERMGLEVTRSGLYKLSRASSRAELDRDRNSLNGAVDLGSIWYG